MAAQDKTEEAQAELNAFRKIHEAMPEDLAYGNRNLAKKVLVIPSCMLKARIDTARKDTKSAIENLKKAIAQPLSGVNETNILLPLSTRK